jgi:hypothetical protein
MPWDSPIASKYTPVIDIWLEMRSRGALARADADKPLAGEIAQCDTAMPACVARNPDKRRNPPSSV